MNRKTALVVGSILVAILFCVAIIGWSVSTFLNNPEVKKGLDVVGEEISSMADLKDKVLQEYPCEDIGIKIQNGVVLNLSLINSEFNDMPYSQQAENAREIALFVKGNFAGKANLTHIVVNFVKNNKFGPFKTFQNVSFPFKVSDLK